MRHLCLLPIAAILAACSPEAGLQSVADLAVPPADAAIPPPPMSGFARSIRNGWAGSRRVEIALAVEGQVVVTGQISPEATTTLAGSMRGSPAAATCTPGSDDRGVRRFACVIAVAGHADRPFSLRDPESGWDAKDTNTQPAPSGQ